MHAQSDAILAEAYRAERTYGEIRSTHEGLGVLVEEFDELKNAIHVNDRGQVYAEAIQVAAVALRLAHACADSLTGSDFSTRSGF